MQTVNRTKCTFVDVILPFVLVIFGACVVTTKKMQFQTKAEGLDGLVHPFRKPWYNFGEFFIFNYFFLAFKC